MRRNRHRAGQMLLARCRFAPATGLQRPPTYACAAPASQRSTRIDGMVKLRGTIRPVETQEVSAEGDSYEEARQALQAQVPEGWELLQVLVER